ncbi:DNA-binding protein RFX2-like [Crassostrea virginica]|uniref:DNA-binding protein RFX2-like n=1 Tax=Crassostrea virginica TaxID=6565 RepID=A0A8B8CKH7_CRAVI|nr:DNA-binding protein RFX2-like [Crassostrea virginica]
MFYFTSNVVSPPYTIYMGEDKHENEELIRWGFPEDVWFHVDKLSSAHVYLRLHPNETLDDVPQSVIDDCAQLVKANSISGNKMNNIDVVYTMWANLKKTQGMDVGQVGFFKDKEVRKVKIEKKINEIVNRLNKTKREEHPDFRKLREDRDREEREDQKRKMAEQKKREKEMEEQKKKEAETRSYANLMRPENMTSNRDDGNDSDDFMRIAILNAFLVPCYPVPEEYLVFADAGRLATVAVGINAIATVAVDDCYPPTRFTNVQMATQTFVTDLQAMNPTVVQVQGSSKSPSTSQSQNGQAQKTTIIQPSQTHSGQQFIVTIPDQLGDQAQNADTVTIQQGGQAVYPTHVQYVDGSDPGIYANGQMQGTYQNEYGQTMYTPVSSTYYQSTGQQLGTVQTVQGQILQHQGGTYLIQGGTMDGEGTPLTHTTRASPATVQWLIDNYETAEGVSLPRSTLYNHYLRHCQEQNLDPMNPASFGKLIRSVFLGLRTRRLGTRGNSKYHYYGIRIKANSPLNQFTDNETMAIRNQPMYHGKGKGETDSDSNHGSHGPHDPAKAQQEQHQQFLGDASAALPNFGDIDTSVPFPEGITIDHIKSFEKMYREHAEAIVDVVVNLQFSLIEALWQGFWRNQPPDQLTADNDYEKRLPKEKLYMVSAYEPLQQWVRKADYTFYQALVEVLIPDVLRPIPSSLTQAIRNFAKSLENWLKGAMTGVPEEMVKTKVSAVSAFAQTLRRYTSLNHLAQAARAVLQNTSQINQMLTDLNRVDFANVQEQASWVCQCDDAVVQQLQDDFKKTLELQNSLEQWAVWLEGVVNQVLKPHEGSDNFPKAARQFLLKWSFYSSMVIRDLTLRSAASFGSFHLIRLLYDEYMFYLVEHKVAAATGETPIAVMGEFIDISSAVLMSNLEAETKPVVISKTATTSAAQTLLNKSETATLMVLSSTGNTNVNGNVIVTAAPGSNPTTVTVRSAGNALPGTKTIVVMPVSNAVGSGDAQNAKRLKVE